MTLYGKCIKMFSIIQLCIVYFTCTICNSTTTYTVNNFLYAKLFSIFSKLLKLLLSLVLLLLLLILLLLLFRASSFISTQILFLI